MTTTPTPDATPAAPVPGPGAGAGDGSAENLRRASDLDLIGRYEGSGFVDPPHLVRRGDGQVVQLSELLYLVAQACDGQRDAAQVAEAVSEQYGKPVNADNVLTLADQLRPLGVLVQADGSEPQLPKLDPTLALRFRVTLLSARTVQPVASLLKVMFWPLVLLVGLGGALAMDVWLFAVHGVAESVRHSINEPITLVAVFALVVVATLFHELGHAAACKYGGARPGRIGAGIYVVYPAFFNDVTDAYRLGRGGRVRVDLGGVYFNLLFSLVALGAYLATGWEPLLLVILALHMLAFQQFLPFVRLDGYYVIADLTGVPDLFSRIKPILSSLVPGRQPPKAVSELKPWARAVVTAWVVITIPVLIGLLATLLVSAPRVLATAWDSLQTHSRQAGESFSGGNSLHGTASVFQAGILALPAAAMLLAGGRLLARLGARGVRWAREGRRTMLRAAVLALGPALVAVVVAVALWPQGNYRPIQEGERGTIGDAYRSVRVVAVDRVRTPLHQAPTAAVPAGGEQEQADPAATDRADEEDQEEQDVEEEASGETTDPATDPGTEPAPDTTSTTSEPAPVTGSDPATSTTETP